MPTKSGKYWVSWAHTFAKNSEKIDDLAPTFRGYVRQFVRALTDAGATVSVSATRRSENRAYLFHWSWKISQGKCKPSEATKMVGVDIEWDHGDNVQSRAGALEMVNAFGLAVPPRSTNPPSLTSSHIRGEAIDMTIKWAGVIKVKKKDGTETPLTFTPNVR